MTISSKDRLQVFVDRFLKAFTIDETVESTGVSRPKVVEFGQQHVGVGSPDFDTLCVPAELQQLVDRIEDIRLIAQLTVTSKATLQQFDAAAAEFLRLLVPLSEGRLDAATVFGNDFAGVSIDGAKTALIELFSKHPDLTTPELEQIVRSWGVVNGSAPTIRNRAESWGWVQQDGLWVTGSRTETQPGGSAAEPGGIAATKAGRPVIEIELDPKEISKKFWQHPRTTLQELADRLEVGCAPQKFAKCLRELGAMLHASGQKLSLPLDRFTDEILELLRISDIDPRTLLAKLADQCGAEAQAGEAQLALFLSLRGLSCIRRGKSDLTTEVAKLMPDDKELKAMMPKLWDSFRDHIKNVPVTQGGQFTDPQMLFCASASSVAGYTANTDMCYYLSQNWEKLREFMPELPPQAPGASRFDRLMRRIDRQPLCNAMMKFTNPEVVPDDGEYIIICFDGKYVRGSAEKIIGGSPVGMVSAVRQSDGKTLFMVPVDGPGNENKAAHQLMDLLHAAGYKCKISFDAGFCNRQTISKANKLGFPIFMQIKGNQKKAVAAIANHTRYNRNILDSATDLDLSKGRMVRRTTRLFDAPKKVNKQFGGVFKIAEVEAANEDGKPEKHLFLTNFNVTAESAAKTARNHWKIEVTHHISDVVQFEDAKRARKDNAAHNGMTLRRSALNIYINSPMPQSPATLVKLARGDLRVTLKLMCDLLVN